MKLCTLQDFEDVGFTVPSERMPSYTDRLCPDRDFYELMQIKNGYTNSKEREAFAIKIYKCKDENRKQGSLQCHSDTVIEKLYKTLVFTLYQTEADVEFGNPELVGKSPLHTSDKFHSQFQLNLNTYHDNNNYFEYNEVLTEDNRFQIGVI
jgi:hypothetical protein